MLSLSTSCALARPAVASARPGRGARSMRVNVSSQEEGSAPLFFFHAHALPPPRRPPQADPCLGRAPCCRRGGDGGRGPGQERCATRAARRPAHQRRERRAAAHSPQREGLLRGNVGGMGLDGEGRWWVGGAGGEAGVGLAHALGAPQTKYAHARRLPSTTPTTLLLFSVRPHHGHGGAAPAPRRAHHDWPLDRARILLRF